METLITYQGFLLNLAPLWSLILGAIVVLLFIGFWGLPLFVWAVAVTGLLFGLGAPTGLSFAVAALFILF